MGATWGSGWAGDALEREWADAMLYFAQHKAERLGQPGYAHYAADWLLVYDNWPPPAVNHNKAAAYLLERLIGSDVVLPFDRIFVECERAIWQFFPPTFAEQAIVEVCKRTRIFA